MSLKLEGRKSLIIPWIPKERPLKQTLPIKLVLQYLTRYELYLRIRISYYRPFLLNWLQDVVTILNFRFDWIFFLFPDKYMPIRPVLSYNSLGCWMVNFKVFCCSIDRKTFFLNFSDKFPSHLNIFISYF